MNNDKLIEAIKHLAEVSDIRLANAVHDCFLALRDDPAPAPKELIWRPKVQDLAYYISDINEVQSSDVWDYSDEATDLKVIESYNVYQHEEDAIADAKYLAVIRKLRHLQRALGKVPTPSNGLVIDGIEGDQVKCSFTFKSRHAAETALAALTADELEVLKHG